MKAKEGDTELANAGVIRKIGLRAAGAWRRAKSSKGLGRIANKAARRLPTKEQS